MSKKRGSTHTELSSHSAAKVDVFTYYLELYLSILGLSKKVQQVHIFDLMCGEAQYPDNRTGSAIAGLRCLIVYFKKYPGLTMQIRYTLNDNGKSKTEKGRLKIDCVRDYAEKLPLADVIHQRLLTRTYTALSFEQAFADARQQTSGLSRTEKALFFIDPWGYKLIRLADLRETLASGHAEILLFLPANMMYRFVRSAYETSSADTAGLQGSLFNEPIRRPADAPTGSEALLALLTSLFPHQRPVFRDVYDFIAQLKNAFREQVRVPYASSFTLETAERNVYALFYLTSSRKGLQAMLEAQWNQDQHTGSGHRHHDKHTFTFFKPGELTKYPRCLTEYLAVSPRTNEELLEFGLQQGFLPKHTNDVLRDLAAQGRLQVQAIDGLSAPPKNSFYTDCKPTKTGLLRRVSITLFS